VAKLEQVDETEGESDREDREDEEPVARERRAGSLPRGLLRS
jgi:hypothetical protein